jgi:signal transduction histidine kinase
MKSLRLKHYGFVALSSILFIVSSIGMLSNLRSAQAEVSSVSITSPTANQKLSNEKQTIKGTAPALKKLTIYDGSKKIAQTTSDVNGKWSVEWDKVTPGKHSLKAYLVDGTVYSTSPYSENSVKALNLNNGQQGATFAAGLTVPEGFFYDSNNNYSYALNKSNHTVSIFNMANNNPVSTISYATQEALASTEFDSSPCRCKNYSYAYDEQARKLYVMDLERIYEISTQTNSVTRTIPISSILQAGNDSDPQQYKLYVDPQSSYLYVYLNSANAANPIHRINLSSGDIDNWTVEGNDLVSAQNGDVYYINPTINEDSSSNASFLYRYSSQTNSSDIINLSSLANCQTGDSTHLAMASDQSTVYVGCFDGPASNFPPILIGISTSDQTIAEIDIAGENAVGSDSNQIWLTEGNVKANKFIIALLPQPTVEELENGVYTNNTVHFVSLNTTNNQVQQSVSADIPHGEQAKLKDRTVISGSGWWSVTYYYSDPIGLITKLFSSDNNLLNTYNDSPGLSSTFLDIYKVASVNDSQIAIISNYPRNSIELQNINTGEFSSLEYGLGGALRSYASKSSNKLYSINQAGGITSQGVVLPSSNRIKVSDLETGEYQTSIRLNSNDMIIRAALDDGGEKLYVLSVNLVTEPTKLKVTRIDTQTGLIDKEYGSVTNIGIDNEIGYLYATDSSSIGLIGDELVFSVSEKVYLLDTSKDTLRTVDNLVPDDGHTPYSKPILAIDPNGKYVAVNFGTDEPIKIIKVSDLSIQSTISGYSANAFTAIFSGKEKVVVNDLTAGLIRVFNPETGELEKTVSIFQDLVSSPGSEYCFFLGGNMTEGAGNYMAGTVDCISTSQNSDGTYDGKIYAVVVDLDKYQILGSQLTKTVKLQSGAILEGYVAENIYNPTVSLATQNVTVVADSVSIIEPAVGKKINAGKHTITGTAPPNKKLNIYADGQNIGSVSSDVYGLWKLDHNFIGKESQIKAIYKVDSYDRAYLEQLYMDTNSNTFYSKLLAIKAGTGIVERELKLPSGYIATNSLLNKSGDKLYVFALDQNMEGARILIYDTSSDKLVRSVKMSAEQIAANGGKAGFNFSVSSDEKYLYSVATNGLYKFDLKTGELVKTYDLGQEFADAQAPDEDFNPFTTPTALVGDKNNLIFVPYFNQHGGAYINTITNEVNQVSVPEGVTLVKTLLDDDHSTLYAFVSFPDGGSTTNVISANNINTFENKWSAVITGYSLSPDMILTDDGNKLISSGVDNQFNPILININSANGERKVDQTSFDQASQLAITSMVSDAAMGVAPRLGSGKDVNNIYSSILAIGKGGLLVNLNVSKNSFRVTLDSRTDLDGNEHPLFFGTFNNNFIKTVPAVDKTATRDLLFTTTAKPPVPVGCVSNCTPVISNNPPKTSKPPKAIISENVSKLPKSKMTVNQPNVLQSFMARLFAATKRFVVSVPLPLVNAFPYILFLLLIGLIGYYLYQTQQQLRREESLRDIYEKQKVLTEEKRNFLELTSHYLRTPLTYIKAGSEMILRNKQNELAATELTESVGHLSLFIESLIEEADDNQALQELIDPKQKVWSPLLQKSFWMPVAGMASALALFYLIFGLIGGINFGPARYVTQLLIMFVIVQLFYGMFKNHRNILKEEDLLTKTVNAEASLDHTRSKLMRDAGDQLKTRTDHLAGVINKLQSADTSKAIMQQGIERLRELSQAFGLVSNLENDNVVAKAEPVSVRTLAADVIKPLAEKFKAKKVKVEISGFDQDISLKTNKSLAEITLKTLLENALQASEEGSSLIVKCLHKDGRTAFQIIDHGAGIPKDKIERLFKPFVRVGPVTTFNREGIGLSLYLDRLIMHSLGGEIEIVSRFKHGTTATISFDQKAAA